MSLSACVPCVPRAVLPRFLALNPRQPDGRPAIPTRRSDAARPRLGKSTGSIVAPLDLRSYLGHKFDRRKKRERFLLFLSPPRRTENTDDFRETRRNPCAVLCWHEGEKSHGYGGERVATYLRVARSIRRKEETSFHVAMEVTGAVPLAGRKGKRKREAAAREREERRTDNVASFIRAVL